MVRFGAAGTPGAYFDFAMPCFQAPMKGLLWASRTLGTSPAKAIRVTGTNERLLMGISPFELR